MTSSEAVSSLWRPTSARKSWSESADPTIASGSGAFGCGSARLRVLLGPRLGDLEADRLELAHQLLDISVVEVVLEREGLDLGRLDVTTLLGGFDQGAGALGLE